MRKRSVPYTIVRGGVYYLNLRWNNQFIRQSLATKDPMEAFQIVFLVSDTRSLKITGCEVN